MLSSLLHIIDLIPKTTLQVLVDTQVVFTSHSKLPDHSIVVPYDGTNTLSNLPASSFVTAHQHSPLTFVKLLVSSNFLYKSRPQLWGREDSQISDLHEQCLLECCRAVQKAYLEIFSPSSRYGQIGACPNEGYHAP